MLETAPAVQAVVEFLKKLQSPKGAKLLATEAKRQRLALAMAVKLTPMASADERRQLHRLLIAAYGDLAERPCLEQAWQSARQETPPGAATRGFVEALYRTIFWDDGLLDLQLYRQVSEALSIDVIDKILGLLAEVVGTEAEPSLHVADIKISQDAVRDYGCLWIVEVCSRIRQGEAPTRTIQQAAGHRRYAPRTYLIAGRALLRAMKRGGPNPTWLQNAEACLLNGIKVAVRDEVPPLVAELIEFYRMTGRTDQVEHWKQQQGGGKPVAAPTPAAAPAEHQFKDMAPYSALFPEEPPIVLTVDGQEWVLNDCHCPDPKCDCGRLFIRMEAARQDGRATFAVQGKHLVQVADEPADEHVEALVARLQPFISGPNEIRLLVQRGREVKDVARAGRWEVQQKIKANALMVHFDHELKSWLKGAPYAVVSLADWLALLRSRDLDGTLTWQQLLWSRGFGMEPDAPSGVPATPPPGLAIFPLPSRAAGAYAGSALAAPGFILARWSMGIMHALHIDPLPYQKRLQALALRPGLTAEDRVRIQATVGLYARFAPPDRIANRGIDKLTAADKAWLARCMVELLHDQSTRPDVVKRLGKVYSLLGVDPHAVFSDLHEAGTAVARSSQGLDRKLVEARLQETRQVDRLLEGIFAEEAAPAPVSKPAAGHDDLLQRLVVQESWSRDAFVALASEAGLLPDAAIDAINEQSLDRFEELALEGDDPLYVNIEIVEHLLGGC